MKSKLIILLDNDNFYILPIWDDEAKVYISKSNIDGLVIEADTLDKFKDMSEALGPELIIANHN